MLLICIFDPVFGYAYKIVFFACQAFFVFLYISCIFYYLWYLHLEWVSEKNAKKEGVQDANSNRKTDSTGSLGLS